MNYLLSSIHTLGYKITLGTGGGTSWGSACLKRQDPRLDSQHSTISSLVVPNYSPIIPEMEERG